ncbi:Bifunctional NAD(P)H-hydrate repair enzyme Nnr [Labeo rohita]|uniref:Bifunctional NAD(P)H-hydrate repair enzyme Nnr n=1 Tax=Labeo rohita TaxID=84645 RepID=A0ABQ8MDL5_LABRO|nr:Bifunctional NAD(P)H-hydrate repair enzyme Nnr [Labeo rohita]
MQHDKFRKMKSLENLMKGESEHREAGEKKKKKRKLKERKTTEPAPLLVEVKPQQTQVSSPVRSSFLRPIEAELPMLPSVSEHFTLPAIRFKPLPTVTKPPMRPCYTGGPMGILAHTNTHKLCAIYIRNSPQKPAAAPQKFLTPLQVVPPSVSEHFALPANRFKPFPSVTKRPMHPQMPAPAPEEVTLPGTPLQVDPPKPLVVPPHPTPAPDEFPPKRLVVLPSPTPAPDKVVALQCSSDEVCPHSLLKLQPATSFLFEPPPQLIGHKRPFG